MRDIPTTNNTRIATLYHTCMSLMLGGSIFYGMSLARVYWHEMGHKVAMINLLNDAQVEIKIDYKTLIASTECIANSKNFSKVGLLLGYNLTRACISSAGWVGEALFSIACSKTLDHLPTNNKYALYPIFFARLMLINNSINTLIYSADFIFNNFPKEANDSIDTYKYGGLYAISFMCLMNTSLLAFNTSNLTALICSNEKLINLITAAQDQFMTR